jgi:hypothetical protein
MEEYYRDISGNWKIKNSKKRKKKISFMNAFAF